MDIDKIYALAYESFDDISKHIGFQDRKIAYVIGFFAGFKKAGPRLTKEEFAAMYKDLCKDAYLSKGAGDMWEPDRYRSWYEKLFKE